MAAHRAIAPRAAAPRRRLPTQLRPESRLASHEAKAKVEASGERQKAVMRP
jgi:hypothetical protein